MAAEGAAARVLAAAARGEEAEAILQVPRGAGLAAARLSFKRLAMLLHPDKNPCNDAAAAFACCRCAGGSAPSPRPRPYGSQLCPS